MGITSLWLPRALEKGDGRGGERWGEAGPELPLSSEAPGGGGVILTLRTIPGTQELQEAGMGGVGGR